MQKGDLETARVAGTMLAQSPGPEEAGRAMLGTVLADGNKEADGAAAKGGAGKDTDVCNLCGQRGHWKWECPTKGKNKGKINQVDVQPPASSAASTLTSASTTLPSASQYRGSVNRVEAFRCENPPGCQITQVYDISELEDEGEFSLQGAEVVAIFAASLESVYEEEWFPDVATQDCHEALEYASGAQVFAMDVTDGDGEWCCSPWLGAGPGDVGRTGPCASSVGPEG